MFRRLFYFVFLVIFGTAAAFSAYFLHKHALVWWSCKDEWGLCFADAVKPLDRIAPMGIPLAYAGLTLVLGLLSLKALWGVLRPARRRYAQEPVGAVQR
ncbi:MAG: hypothetical protein KDJ47_00730 [Hyphomicrobiaceae bacterium]|nr:hypothetical protein [Hyphomicrobiaceae bacterium]